MKKVLSCLFALVLIAGMSFAQGVTDNVQLNLSLNLMPYIETMPGPVDVNLGNTRHNAGYAPSKEWYYNFSPQTWNLAYANCPFSVNIAGDNPAGEGKPRFARLETGAHANGYDTIPTLYAIHFTTNGVSDLFFGEWLQGAHQFPHTKNYTEAPHNGQVKMNLDIWANANIASEAIPIRGTLINPAFTIRDSADAGIYTCSMVVTLTAL